VVSILKIAIVALGIYPLSTGGVEVHCYKQGVELMKLRVGVVALTKKPRVATAFGTKGVRVVAVGARFPGFGQLLFVLGTMANLLRIRKLVDLVHVHYATYFALPVYFFSILSAKPYVVTCHGSDIVQYRRSRVFRSIQRVILTEAACVTTTSTELRDIVLGEYHLDSSRVLVIPNGVDDLETKSILETVSPQSKGRVILVANLREIKDPITAVQAFGIVSRTQSEARLIIVGDGPSRTQVESEIRTLGLGNQILLTGILDHREVLREIAKSNIFILTSLFEGGNPLALMEAMALRKPVISSDVGGVRDVIINGENGLLFPPRSAVALAEAILLVLQNDALAESLAANAKRTAARYTWTETAKTYQSLYNAVLSQN
jgi:glycosyltransferase involved in cell wall biosynthesis